MTRRIEDREDRTGWKRLPGRTLDGKDIWLDASGAMVLRDHQLVARSVTLADFPHAPPGAYVSEEGWLVTRDEAWTVHEWRIEVAVNPVKTRRYPNRGQRRYETEEEREAAKRLARQAYRDRQRQRVESAP